jgi:hypothetical protein
MSLAQLLNWVFTHTALCHFMFTVQNAGKSSLISAMKRVGGTAGQRDPTVAPLPGTTLGLINVPGKHQRSAAQRLCESCSMLVVASLGTKTANSCYVGTGNVVSCCYGPGKKQKWSVFTP